MTILVGLFSRAPKDPQTKDSVRKFKELKKLVKEKKVYSSSKIRHRIFKKTPNHHDVLFIVGGIYYIKNEYKTAISYFYRSLEIGFRDIDVLLLKAHSNQKLD